MKKTYPIIIVLFLMTISSAHIIHVPGDYLNIQAAIDAAVTGDTVLISEGTYYENVIIESKSVTLGSHFLVDFDTSHISKTVINGRQPVQTDFASVVAVNNSADISVICGLTITEGYGTKVITPGGPARIGGGINSISSNIIISDNRITNNRIDKTKVPDDYDGATGGGICIFPFTSENLSTVIRNNIITDNFVESPMTAGGGIGFLNQLVTNTNYLVECNIISDNAIYNTDEWKAMGGGILLDFTLPTSGNQIIRNNIISNNQALCVHSFGGAMYIVIEERTADGALDSDPGPFIYNNIISGNHSDYLGGAVSVWRAYFPADAMEPQPLSSFGHYTPKPSFINNTIVNNTAQDGSAFYIMNHIPFLMNNILWNNYPVNAPWGEIFLGNEAHWTSVMEPNRYGGMEICNSVVQGDRWADIDKGVWDIDPAFADTIYHLADTSPGIGTGRPLVELNGIAYQAPDVDIEGNARPHSVDAYFDLGAYESTFMAQPRPLCLNLHCEGKYFNPNQPSPVITTEVSNAHGENLRVYAHLQQADSAEVLSTTELYDDGAHADQQAGDHIYGGTFDPFSKETILNLFLSIENLSRGETKTFHDNNRFTSIGPIAFDHYIITSADTIPNANDRLKFKVTLRNDGLISTATNVTAKIYSLDDSLAKKMQDITLSFDDIAPGDSATSTNSQYINFAPYLNGQVDCPFRIEIGMGGYIFWTTDFTITNLESRENKKPDDFALFQNYPNPFNPATTIQYQLPQTSQVELSIYTLLGQKVATLVSGKQTAGTYQVEWDVSPASGAAPAGGQGQAMASGLYLYRLQTDHGFTQTRKLVLLK